MKRFKHVKQHDAKDCGPACLQMISAFYGKDYSLQTFRERSFINREGVSMLGISDAAESVGFRTIGLHMEIGQLTEEAPLPCIVHWKQHHFVVVYDAKPGKWVKVADPAFGLVKLSISDFVVGWTGSNNSERKGIALLLEPSPDFYNQPGETQRKTGFLYLLRYLKPQKTLYSQLILGIILGSFLQLIFPLLTQSIVDKGIGRVDLDFIYIILIAMFVLILSRTAIDFLRNRILMHMGSRINILLISDFLIKLMRLPVGFFDSKLTGDIMQRIWDHQRIQYFLTTTSLNILFGIFSFFVFSIVLVFYSFKILAIFLLGSLLYFLWIRFFMKKRRELDYKRFSRLSENQSTLFEIITGMQEIRLNNCEYEKRAKWENIQAGLFKINMKSLGLTQYQQSGGLFFNESKNLLITFVSAWSVIHGEMTMGMMVAVQYIIGQLNGPVDQMIGFFQAAQDARISLERFGELQNLPDEESADYPKKTILPDKIDLNIRNLTFHYEGPRSPAVLHNLNIVIPEGKVTAIVGPSGSGKTTLLKLLLGFYEPAEGEICVGTLPLSEVSNRYWRSICGTVMQDGFIFSDTIARNIAPSGESIDKQKLLNAAKIANILEFVNTLPMGFNTKIGQEGSGLSQGQRQRILIARAVYKNPQFLFFDEATNALDAENESVIMKNLASFYYGRTVIIVAHRLSTVKNADQIILLDKGKISEFGKHEELIKLKGLYYKLIKNQLELGE